MAALPPSPQGWVALSPPRTPVVNRYDDVSNDVVLVRSDDSAQSSAHAANETVSPLASGRYAAARVDLSSQLSEMEADIAGLESAAHRSFGNAVDRYHNLIVRITLPERALALEVRMEWT